MFRNPLRRRAQAAPRRAPAAVPLGVTTPRLLTADDFTAGTPILGVPSRLAVFETPRGEILELDTARPFRFGIKSRHEVTVTANSSGEGTIDLDALGVDMVRSTRPAPTLPSSAHPDVIVRTLAGAAVTITALDFDANEIDVSGLTPSVDNDLVVYALPGNGEVKLRAVQPAGVDESSVELFNDTLKALHETDQARGETAPRLMRGSRARYPLAPKWLLVIEVNSPLPLTLAPASVPLLQFHAYRHPVAVTDAAAVNQAVAGQLR